MYKEAKKKGAKYLSKNVQTLKIFRKRAGDCAQLSHATNC